MAGQRNIRPKVRTSQEISQEIVNQRPPYAEEPNKPEINRSHQIRRDEDTVADYSVGFEDHDRAIKYYFEKVIRPKVSKEGAWVEVPIIYGSPERWKSIQKDGYYRDKNGKIQTPLIMFRRTSFEKRQNLGNKLDGNVANNYYIFPKEYSKRNNYDRFDLVNNRIPQKEYHAVIIPDYMDIGYECIVWTDYMTDMNSIIEAINFSNESYWGDKERFKFKATIGSFSPSTELNLGDDRLIRTSFNIKLLGYIIPKSINRYIAENNTKYFSKAVVTINQEIDSTLETFTVAGKKEKSIPTLGGGTGKTVVPSNQILYLGLNNVKVATPNLTTPTTATFENTTIAVAPIGLPPTSINNFTIFIGGQYLEHRGIVSLVQSGTNVVLTIDPNEVGFNLDAQDEIVAIGKFSN